MACEHALGLHGSGRVTFEALHPMHLLILSCAEIREPVVTQGPFIINEPSNKEADVRLAGKTAPIAGGNSGIPALLVLSFDPDYYSRNFNGRPA